MTSRDTYPEAKPRYDVVWALNKRMLVEYDPYFGRRVMRNEGDIIINFIIQ